METPRADAAPTMGEVAHAWRSFRSTAALAAFEWSAKSDTVGAGVWLTQLLKMLI
jgi:hypothetical protein